MSDNKLQVALIGCGNMGQHYGEVYSAYDDVDLVAIAEYNDARRETVGERFGVKALYKNAEELFDDIVPDLAAVVLPVKYMKDAVIAAAQAGVKGVSAEKPIAATLADADAMIEACESRGIVFAGGSLQRAMREVQEAASWLKNRDYGQIVGASVHRFGGEISGGGCQHISVLRLLCDAEVGEVIAWGRPPVALAGDQDGDLYISGQFKMTNGVDVAVFAEETSSGGVEVWTEDALVSWDWGPPKIYQGFDNNGARILVERPYTDDPWRRFSYLGASVRSFIDAVRAGGGPLAVSGHDLRQALEVAIAAKLSALRHAAPVSLPLEDRSLTLYPTPGRWEGFDQQGRQRTVADDAQRWLGDP